MYAEIKTLAETMFWVSGITASAFTLVAVWALFTDQIVFGCWTLGLAIYNWVVHGRSLEMVE